MSEKLYAIFMGDSKNIERVYGFERKEKIKELCEVFPDVISKDNFIDHSAELGKTNIIFSTWGMLQLTEDEIRKMPALKAVFYGAGSVQQFARPFLKSGVKVFSAWAANAVPVAEFSIACILFGLKQAYPCIRDKAIETIGYKRPPIKGIYDTTVGVVSMGMIGRKVCELLQNFHVNIVAFDPFVPESVFEKNNVRRVELDELFSISDVVSVHTPNLESTRGLITGKHFRMMKEYSTFINTARGAVINQEEMINVLRERSDISVHLDVVTRGNEDIFVTLPNVYFTPHIAGSIGNECWRMADYMIDEFMAWQNGDLTRYEVTESMLKTMA